MKARGSVAPGDAESAGDPDSVDGAEDSEK